ncbi:hypothetical protein KKD37_03485 [Patescibacteria group bacterium]|nr:hypothetical protein [Patescibacteria group bacterium]
MRVYFSASLYPEEEFQSRYKKIVSFLVNSGYDVFEDITKTPYSKFLKFSDKENKSNYVNALSWIKKCDFAVFEASFPSSISIGYEISVALGKGKPVIVMYQEDRSPRFMMANKDSMIIYAKYADLKDGSGIERALVEPLVRIRDKVNTRFNMFVPSSLMAYLDWVTKDRGVNKSEYVRSLIDDKNII